ncbi:universal stress protein [Qipengyuania sp. 1NDH17]|uniref:Universal stress protein n=1 Tax=Qipengyuania polymorpha TaxID=2867234 RepID=A0ABS7IY66_9SPHN|nr:universal stress protein [Qipengyuania polymorpha]MBX7456759.1 universal stress protein [Qipengyuania polymorpha]
MKAILFNAHSDEGHSRRLDVALDLARAFDGHLTLLNAVPYEAAASADPYGAAFAAMVPVWREQAKKLREATEKDLANEDVPWDWVDKAGPVSLAMLRRSSLADLIIIGERDPTTGGKAPSFTAGELAVTAGCPVLVLPDDCDRLDFDKPALVAWDGSAEASHALRAAVPLLKRASSVYLVSVRTKKSSKKDTLDLPPTRGADYLSYHGIKSEVVEVDEGEEGTAHALQNAADVRGVGLIVMGAYGRTRISEWIFGGVTRAILSDVRVPLLLKH